MEELLTEKKLKNILNSRFYSKLKKDGLTLDKKTRTTDSDIRYPIAESLIKYGETISHTIDRREIRFNGHIYRIITDSHNNGNTIIEWIY